MPHYFYGQDERIIYSIKFYSLMINVILKISRSTIAYFFYTHKNDTSVINFNPLNPK